MKRTPSIFFDEKPMPLVSDEGGFAVTFTDMVMHHDPIDLWHPKDIEGLAENFERIRWNLEVVN